MQVVGWLVVVIVVVLVALAAWAGLRQRRHVHLRDRFGPEYDRAVNAADTPRQAHQVLSDRERRRSELAIVPLSEAVRLRYAEQWRAVQERFVDQPVQAVDAAQQLLDQVMTDRGYPVCDVGERADLISVDHPGVVENYRIAHQIHARTHAVTDLGSNDTGATEELRVSLQRYRSFFQRLLSV